MPDLTEAQRIAIAELDARGAEAIWFEDHWRFREDIKEDPELADRLVAADIFASALYWPLA